ncbi:hypothetical protein AB0K51_12435 [Kitasatospora sp. NPDC049285]|uniref:Acb2/Tad1 domain-containing protein n=1 Tax=Kitasatospora sp. NPDC049285 TaxID=3157096 RepID=UPI003434C1BB
MSGDEGLYRAFPEIARQEHDAELVERFSYHPPRPGQPELYEQVRAAGLDFARLLNSYVPGSPELTHAVDSIDQAVMWANAGIARRS